MAATWRVRRPALQDPPGATPPGTRWAACKCDAWLIAEASLPTVCRGCGYIIEPQPNHAAAVLAALTGITITVGDAPTPQAVFADDEIDVPAAGQLAELRRLRDHHNLARSA